MPKFRCTVAIPTRELFHGEIEYAQIPGSEGDLGVMAGHEMFVCTNRPGVLTLTLDEAGKDKRYFVTLSLSSRARAMTNRRLCWKRTAPSWSGTIFSSRLLVL